MTYTIAQITHTYPAPFKPQTLWHLFINGVEHRGVTFTSKTEALRGAKVLARRWPGTITVNTSSH